MTGKKLVAARIASAVADLDFAKKKSAAGDKEETEKLKKAHELKKNALKDQIDSLNDKMSSLETNPALKAIGQSVRIKAKQEASKKLLKAADAEEAKELKVKLSQLADQEKQLINDYESTVKDGTSTGDSNLDGDIRKEIEKQTSIIKSSEEALELIAKNKEAKPDGDFTKSIEKEIDKIFNAKAIIAKKKGDDFDSKGEYDKLKRTYLDKNAGDDDDEMTDDEKSKKAEEAINNYKKLWSDKEEIKKQMEAALKANDEAKHNELSRELSEFNKPLREIATKIKELGGEVPELTSMPTPGFQNAKESLQLPVDKLVEEIQKIKNQLETNPDFNRTNESRMEVERRIRNWEQLLVQMNELNASSIESTINIDMAQLEKDIFALNAKQPEKQSETVRLAMQEAAALGGAQKAPEQQAEENVAKLDKTRALMKAAGLI